MAGKGGVDKTVRQLLVTTMGDAQARALHDLLRTLAEVFDRARRSPDGLVDVVGGTVILPSHLREKLSTLQARAGTASAP